MLGRRLRQYWYSLTPSRFLIGLLAVQIFLLLSEDFRWFNFNGQKGCTVLIAVAVFGAAVLVMLVWCLVGVLIWQRLQFGLRSLLLFIFVLTVPLGWFVDETQQAKKQREAVEAIAAVGGIVHYGGQYEDMIWPTARPPRLCLWLLEQLGRDFFFPVTKVDCTLLVPLGDEELIFVRNLPMLEELYLADTQVSDHGVKHLVTLSNLRLLVLIDTQVTDEGVESLQEALPKCHIDH